MVSELGLPHSEFSLDHPGSRPRESDFSDRPLSADRPSLFRRASGAVVRYLIAVGIGVGGTLAWQSHGEAAREIAATWAAAHGWSLPWLSSGAARRSTASSDPEISAPPAAQDAPVRGAARETTAPPAAAGTSLDLQQLEDVKVSLAAMRERIERLAAGQEQMTSDIVKLQTSEQEIRQKMSVAQLRPAAAPAAKSAPTSAPPARAPISPRDVRTDAGRTSP